jgi:hypothetical protein
MCDPRFSDLTTNREPMPTAGANPLPCRSPEKHDRFCLPVSRAGARTGAGTCGRPWRWPTREASDRSISSRADDIVLK